MTVIPSSMLFLAIIATIFSSSVDVVNGQLPIGGVNSAQDLSSTCPAEFTRLSPCIENSNALSDCVTCVTDFVLTSEADALNITTTTTTTTSGEEEEEIITSTTRDSDVEVSSEAPTMVPYTCDNVRQDVCTAIEQCGEVCGLVERNTVLTFGRDCEDLFLKMVTCALGNMGSVTVTEQECELEGTCDETPEEDEEVVDKDEADKDAALSYTGHPLAILATAVAVAFTFV